MRIGNLSKFNQSFGVNLDTFSRNEINKTKKAIVTKYGKKSEKYKNFCNDVKDLKKIHPDDRLFYDMNYDANRIPVWLAPNNPYKSLTLLGIISKNEMLSSNNIHKIAERLRKL